MRENWKIWENYLYTALELKKLQESVFALNRLFDLRGKDYPIDQNVFNTLTDIAVDVFKEYKSSKDEQERAFMFRIYDSVNKLLQRTTSMYGTNPLLWGLSSKLSVAVGKGEDAIEERMKQCRSLKVDGWETEKDKFFSLCDGCIEMMETNIEIGNSKTIYSAKSFVRIILAKTKQIFADSEQYQKLESTYEKLLERDNQLKSN